MKRIDVVRTGMVLGSLILASMLAACGSGSDSGSAQAQTGQGPGESAVAATAGSPVGGGYATPGSASPDAPSVTAPSTPPATSASAPAISGSPQTTARSGVAYVFQPTATVPAGATATFSISGKPSWASFDATNGRLSGTPGTSDVGNYGNIAITVASGSLSASLAPFGILVSPAQNNSATLSWTPPTQNTDGTTLTNLAGYRIYYGTSADSLTQSIQVTNPGLTSYTIGNLNSGTYYFAISAYTQAGVEGERTTVGSKTMT